MQIDQNISTGTCRLQIGRYVEEVEVMMEPQSASCNGFNVPVENYKGNEILIEVTSGSKSGKTEMKIND